MPETEKECPRCGNELTRKLADSPVKGAWEVYGCDKCNFIWRSTEDLAKLASIDEKTMTSAIWLWGGRKNNKMWQRGAQSSGGAS